MVCACVTWLGALMRGSSELLRTPQSLNTKVFIWVHQVILTYSEGRGELE